MIVAEIKNGSLGLREQYAIRTEVFTKEQGISIEIDQDDYDINSDHVIIYEDNVAVGTGRIINKEDTWLIGRIAVLKNYRGKHYGDLIVRKLVDYGLKNGYNKIVVHSQVQVLNFYRRIGFVEYGDVYLEAGIQHKSMYIDEDNFYKQCT